MRLSTGRHHGRGADLEDLQDVRLLASAEGGDAGVYRPGRVAFVRANDDVVLLRGIECFDLLGQQLTQAAGEGVPSFNLGRSLCHAGMA